MSQLIVHITADADDGRDDGSAWTAVQNGDTVGFSSVVRSAGFRFTGITIAPGATITSATLTVYENNFDTGGAMTVTVAAWKTNNPAAFDSTNRPSAVAKTTATVSWTFNSSTNLFTSFDSPDLGSVISELYAAYGFSSSSVAITVVGGGSGNSAYFEDLHAAAGHEAILTINYTAGSARGLFQSSPLDGVGQGGAGYFRNPLLAPIQMRAAA